MSPTRPHVAIICPACAGQGAVANVAMHYAREIAKSFRVTIVSDSFPDDRPPGSTRLALDPIRFDCLRRFGHLPNEVAFAFAARAALAKCHAMVRVDWIICHGHPVSALTAAPLRRKLGIRYALVTHGDIRDRPPGTYDSRLTWLYRRTTPAAYKNSNLVIALSPHMASLAVSGGATRDRVALIPNGIDLAEIGLQEGSAGKRGGNTNRLELLYVGRLSVEKGVDVLLEAAALLSARDVNFRLRVVGAGAEHDHLRMLAAQRKLVSSVEFLGPRSRLELGAIYRTADVVCVPSRSDPLPTVALEAMAAGVAVAGANTGGIPFMIKHEEHGLIFPAGDAGALASTLLRFSGDGGLAQRLGEAGALRARQVYSWSNVGRALCAELSRAATLQQSPPR